ncbi:cell division protein ZapA [Parerythrobacter jejuensis]|uniref:Cell division protein ZapA n=1 Tax=Parerythrobacter jejuensis TaxID=795812 RepID=A0A845AN06_9SPHN|nr:cell division protein ZapA [Parerythrobacter jejuensis]MXP32192.1 cell division protein ZapA [Parerythrobacter jejuensis]
MNQLDLTIGGRTFQIACEPGEEDHVRNLGALIDEKFQELAPRYEQNLLFATLMLTDDLHSTRSTAETAVAERLAMAKEIEHVRRDAETATGQRDQLRQTIADREQELEQLKTTHAQQADEVQALQTEIESIKTSANESAETMRAEVERIKASSEEAIVAMKAASESADANGAELNALTQERDQLAAQLAAAREELSARPATQGSFIEPGMSTNDPELAPALERFAELLENCADKLEGTGPAS